MSQQLSRCDTPETLMQYLNYKTVHPKEFTMGYKTLNCYFKKQAPAGS